MHIGEPTPFRPARKTPPPVPPPSPGPRPPPEPLPIPVPFPFPSESVTFFASGSPKFAMLGLWIFKSGGPSREGSIASLDRKSTRLNSSHSQISYAVFCLKKKKRLNRFHESLYEFSHFSLHLVDSSLHRCHCLRIVPTGLYAQHITCSSVYHLHPHPNRC